MDPQTAIAEDCQIRETAVIAPLLEYEIDYQTWPVSRRLMRLQMHRLVAQLGNVGR